MFAPSQNNDFIIRQSQILMTKLPTSFGLDERISFVEVKQTDKQTNKNMSNVIQVGYWKKDHHNFIEPKWM